MYQVIVNSRHAKGQVILKTIATVSLVLIAILSSGQQFSIDRAQIDPLIREWNYANNSRSITSFKNVYGSKMLFYTENISAAEAIQSKANFFSKRPEFRQQIVGEIQYTAYSAGVIKCEFEKRVMERSGWKSYPSYLLISYEDNRHWIVGESDVVTDSRLKYKLDIGEPIFTQAQPDTSSSVDTAQTVLVAKPDSAAFRSEISKTFSGIVNYVTSTETVPVRRDHMFMLVGLLVVGTILIVVADRQRRKRDKDTGRTNQQQENLVNAQTHFQEFVITLFDPLYFSPARRRVPHTSDATDEREPDLLFRFSHKGKEAEIGVQSYYFHDINSEMVDIPFPTRLKAYRHYQEVHEIQVYYVLGFGGKPDDPRELYLLPCTALSGEPVRKIHLKPFLKSGMFFYNHGVGRLV